MKSIKQKFWNIGLISLAYMINASEVLAALPWTNPEFTPPAWTTWTNFKTAFMSMLNYFLWFLWLLALVMIIYAGVRMVLAQWEDEEFWKARTMIIYSIVWLVVVILSYSIVTIIIGAPTS